jgi:hypothetical protein
VVLLMAAPCDGLLLVVLLVVVVMVGVEEAPLLLLLLLLPVPLLPGDCVANWGGRPATFRMLRDSCACCCSGTAMVAPLAQLLRVPSAFRRGQWVTPSAALVLLLLLLVLLLAFLVAVVPAVVRGMLLLLGTARSPAP